MTGDARPLPRLDALAAARLKANAGRYTVLVDERGQVVGPFRDRMVTPVGSVLGSEPVVLEDHGRGLYRRLGRDELLKPENAAAVRDNALDVFEELADAYNILGLLRERLTDDGLFDTFRRDQIANLQADLGVFAARVRMLRDDLPAEYRRDGYPVKRDEVA